MIGVTTGKVNNAFIIAIINIIVIILMFIYILF